MSQKTDSQLSASAAQIYSETAANANTANRVGQLFADLVDSKINGGSGSNGYIPKWSGVNQLTSSIVFQSGNTSIGIGTSSPNYTLDVNGSGNFNSSLIATSVTASVITASSIIANSLTGSLPLISKGSVTASVDSGQTTFSIISGSTTMLFVSKSGNIGIGTSYPNNGKLTIVGGSTNDSIPELSLSGSNGFTAFLNSSGPGSWNPIAQDGDKSIIFSEGAMDNSGTSGTSGFTIGPWSSAARGMRMDMSGSIGIGTSANSSAALEISSSNKGFILPRVPQTSSIASPVNGMMIYRLVDNSVFVYASGWKKVTLT